MTSVSATTLNSQMLPSLYVRPCLKELMIPADFDELRRLSVILFKMMYLSLSYFVNGDAIHTEYSYLGGYAIRFDKSLSKATASQDLYAAALP